MLCWLCHDENWLLGRVCKYYFWWMIFFCHVKHFLLWELCQWTSLPSLNFPDLWMHDSTLQPGYSLRTFVGHSTTVTSLDFHPTKEDLICSCDNNSEIRYWSIKNGSCAGVFKVCSLTIHLKKYNALSLFSFASPTVTISSLFLFFLSGWCNPDEISTSCWKVSCSCSR